MNQRTEKTLQIVAAIVLGLLAVPLWPAHRMIVTSIFVMLGVAMVKASKTGK